MFEPFFTTKQSGRGTGLGLATVLSIVKGHQGFLDVQSQVGKGTTVCIYLPAVEVDPTEAGTPQTASRVERRAGTVLVVDDEASIRQMLQVSLGARGWRVLTACNGAEALSAVSEHADELDAVVLDMMMPVMDGATALPLLRKLKPDLRFVLISGLRQADTLREQVGDADVTFLQKPFSLDKLEEAMRGSALSGGSQPTVPCGAVGRGVCAPLRTDGPAAAAVD
jgi:CheY-like chemotaxis protein